MISDPQELYHLLATPGIKIKLFCSDEVVWASWKYVDEGNVPGLRHTDDVLGYVTAVARLRLQLS
jgi:hypothetical protein